MKNHFKKLEMKTGTKEFLCSGNLPKAFRPPDVQYSHQIKGFDFPKLGVPIGGPYDFNPKP